MKRCQVVSAPASPSFCFYLTARWFVWVVRTGARVTPAALSGLAGLGASAADSSLSILDGVEVNIPLITDDFGLFRCPDCAYQTSNKAHYRMHVMIHRPRKWQCVYCQLKFPLLYVISVFRSISLPLSEFLRLFCVAWLRIFN